MGHPPLDSVHDHNYGGLPNTFITQQTPTRTTWPAIWLTVAHGIAQRSLCARDKVGAVIVSPDNTPLMASYNGPPAGFDHQDRPCTEWCPRARGDNYTWEWPITNPVGAPDMEMSNEGVFALVSGRRVALTSDEQYEQLGFRKKMTLSSNYEDCPALHAEANAISRSSHIHRKGGIIYVTSDVCYTCAKLISNAGIREVVVDQRMPRPYRNSQRSYDYLTDLGIHVILIKTDEDLFL